MVADLSAQVRRALVEQPPLNQSYFATLPNEHKHFTEKRRGNGANGRSRLAEATKATAINLKALKQKLVQQGVKYCLGAYVDIHGVPKGKFVPIEHFEYFAHGSELYTGYALDGLGQAPNDDEISSVPDLRHK